MSVPDIPTTMGALLIGGFFASVFVNFLLSTFYASLLRCQALWDRQYPDSFLLHNVQIRRDGS